MWSTLRKEKVRMWPTQFSMALGIEAKTQLVSVTHMKLIEGWEPTACPGDYSAKQAAQPERIQHVLLARTTGKSDYLPTACWFSCIGAER